MHFKASAAELPQPKESGDLENLGEMTETLCFA